MKPIFCTDVTLDKNNETINGAEFITATAPEGMRTVLEDKASKLEKSIEATKLPSWMVTIRSVAGFLALILAISVFTNVTEVGFSAIFSSDNLLVTLLCAACAVAWFMLNRYEKTREKSVTASENIEGQSQVLENELATIYMAMGVPQNAENVDILMFQYKVKDGDAVPCAPALMPTPYINFENKIFDGGDFICFADSENVYSFAKEELKAIRTIEKRISVPSWNKAIMPTQGEYAAYGMTVNKTGLVFMKKYHILELEHDGELLGIYFPCYELDTFEKLTGLREDCDADENTEENLISAPSEDPVAEIDDAPENDSEPQDTEDPEAEKDADEDETK